MEKKHLDLSGFTGSETWYRHAINRGVTYTEGAKALADEAGAYWLLDEIALQNLDDKKLQAEEFQVWTLTRDAEGNGAMLSVEDGNHHVITSKHIEYTDFPERQFTLWYTDHVILLPSEY